MKAEKYVVLRDTEFLTYTRTVNGSTNWVDKTYPSGSILVYYLHTWKDAKGASIVNLLSPFHSHLIAPLVLQKVLHV